MHKTYYCLSLIVVLAQVLVPTAGESLQVDINNVKDIVQSSELVLLLFYANRCWFSMQMLPKFDAAADLLRSQYGNTGKVTLGKVNCEEEPELEIDYNIGKYPTVKIVRHQHIAKKEYRGQRSTEAIVQFAKQELRDPIEPFNSMNDLYQLTSDKYMLMGYFQREDDSEYENFRKVAHILKEKCQFHVNFAERNVLNEITFRRSVDHVESHAQYTGNMYNFTELLSWSQEKCEPIIRVLTYDNAEELAEEGKPFVILFHHNDDRKSIMDFENVILAELMDERDNVNFLIAEGNRFSHPLSHLNKTEADLPLIAIDSFVHMYMFRKFKDLYKPSKLKDFIGSLRSGDLHWDYHFDNPVVAETEKSSEESDEKLVIIPARESKFKELLPSKYRYTFAKEEL